MERLKSPLEKWIETQKSESGFENALQRLISFACAEWIRRGSGEVVSQEEALARVLAARLSEFPLGNWLDHPREFTLEIADFCEKTKVLPLPETLKGAVPTLLDLRGVACPGNAARSRLVMAGLPDGASLTIYLDDGSPIENVPGSLVADGHSIEKREKKQDFWELKVVKRSLRV